MQISDLKEKALKNKIPIIQDEGLEFLLDIIKKNDVKNVLEIGSAVGYSAISMAALDVVVITVEKDADMFYELQKNIKDFNLEQQIFPIFGDALKVDITGKFDLIFIDAAKSKYEQYFTKFKDNLAPNGVIVCDNLDFHGLKKHEVRRRTRKLLEKIEKFIQFLEENEEFDTVIHHVGDGMSVSKRKL